MPTPNQTKTVRTGPLKQAGLVALFAIITALVGAVLNFLLTDDIHSYSRIMLEELYAKSGQIDTLFLGSSHCYRSFDPAAVDEALGTSSFNAGTSQQLPDGTYWMLREAADLNDLDTVYIETFYTVYNTGQSSDTSLATFLITDYLRADSPYRYRYLWEMGGLAAFADLVFPARHAIVTPDELTEVWRAKLTDGYEPGNYTYVTYPEEAYRGDGFVYTWGTAPYGYGTILDVDPDAPLSDFGWDNLERITDFCNGSGIRLVLVTAPLPSAYAADTANYQAYVDAMRAFAAESGVQYWDFTLYRDAAALDLGTGDFADAHHLNGQGAEKFTAEFCRVAAQNDAGQDVQGLFYDTLEQKLANAPDGTLAG